MVDEAPTSIDNKRKWKREKIAEIRRQCNLLICLDEQLREEINIKWEGRGGIHRREKDLAGNPIDHISDLEWIGLDNSSLFG